MKKEFFLAILAIGFVFNSCKNDDSEEDNTETIVGIWKPIKEIAISGSNGNTISTQNASTCYKKSTFDFKSNNTVASTIFDDQLDGSCKSYGTENLPYSYEFNGKKLIIDNEQFEVISHTKNELQFVANYEDENNDGIEDKIIIVLNK